MFFSRHLTDTTSAAASATSFRFPSSASSDVDIAPPGVPSRIPSSTSHLFSQPSPWFSSPSLDLKRSSSQALYHPTILGIQNTIGQNEAWYSTSPLAKRPRYESGSNLPIYPQRPGEKDCAHYMLTRTCKFGESCKFDHPIWVPEGGIPDWKEVPDVTNETLPERPGEPDCPYFVKTQRCKFGPRCKFNHPKVSSESAGVSDLPDRPSEPPCAGEVDCPFYMKTGSCKYGSSCRYNHPDRTAINPPVAALGPSVLASSAANLNIGLINPAAPVYQAFDPRLSNPMSQLGMAETTYPQRPGQIECDYYMKTGICKFGERCKFHHPIDRSAPSQQTVKLTPAGLPRREGAVICPYYLKTGTCKYGPTCKFDHPPPGEVLEMAKSQTNGGDAKDNENVSASA
ncbi:hypothetical protein TanjilG_06649 [Lupinus angustifolius]|uniref:C3H1-type domain-containing protein n=1 Tax=Lupinus angustifolius TaxID=3871 RepID=A0A1J7HNT8_LUPAN|nr:hypothetical protein TanjilG_06649 [Lupinus angustifolius]